MPKNFQTNLAKYAELAVRVGVNLQAGQRLVINGDLQTVELVRLAAKHAYQIGARLVDVLWDDSELLLTRFENAPRDTLSEMPEGQLEGALAYARAGDPVLTISSRDPNLLSRQDPELVATYATSVGKHFQPYIDLLMRDAFAWLVLAVPTTAWAARVFPDLEPVTAREKLWDAVFQVCRIYEPDPISAWRAHLENLARRVAALNAKQFSALHFRGRDTDLHVGLPPHHVWVGGTSDTTQGVSFVANIPTEEVYTGVDRLRVDGFVKSTCPLSVRGTMIQQFSLRFEQGRVTHIEASNNLPTLEKYLDTDEGARFLGEVALVPHNNPIARTGILFQNALFDENAASHLALGNAYPTSIENGGTMSAEELRATGLNHSLVHLDFMIGSGEMNVDGVRADGSREAVMRNGEWIFET